MKQLKNESASSAVEAMFILFVVNREQLLPGELFLECRVYLACLYTILKDSHRLREEKTRRVAHYVAWHSADGCHGLPSDPRSA